MDGAETRAPSRGPRCVRDTVCRCDGDGYADVVAGAGEAAGSRVTAYAGAGVRPDGVPESLLNLQAFPAFGGGVFVG